MALTVRHVGGNRFVHGPYRTYEGARRRAKRDRRDKRMQDVFVTGDGRGYYVHFRVVAELADNPKRPPKHWWKGCVRGVRDSGSAASPEEVCGSLWYHKLSAAQKKRVLKDEGKMKENPSDKIRWEVRVVDPQGRERQTRIFKTRREAEAVAANMRPHRPGWKYTVHKFVVGVGSSRNNPTPPCSTCPPDVFADNPSGGAVLLFAALGAGLLWLLWPKQAAATTPSTPAPGLPPGGPATCPLSAANLDAWGSATGVPVVYLPGASPPLTQAILATVPGLSAVLEAGNVPVIVLGDGSFWTLTFATGLWLPAPAPAQKDAYCNWVIVQGATAPPPQAPQQAPQSPVQQATQFIPNV